MKRRNPRGVVALASIIIAVGACHPVTTGEEVVLNQRILALEQTLARHRQASQSWAYTLRLVVNCLEKREYGHAFPVIDTIPDPDRTINCAKPFSDPSDPPSTPPPNSGW